MEATRRAGRTCCPSALRDFLLHGIFQHTTLWRFTESMGIVGPQAIPARCNLRYRLLALMGGYLLISHELSGQNDEPFHVKHAYRPGPGNIVSAHASQLHITRSDDKPAAAGLAIIGSVRFQLGAVLRLNWPLSRLSASIRVCLHLLHEGRHRTKSRRLAGAALSANIFSLQSQALRSIARGVERHRTEPEAPCGYRFLTVHRGGPRQVTTSTRAGSPHRID